MFLLMVLKTDMQSNCQFSSLLAGAYVQTKFNVEPTWMAGLGAPFPFPSIWCRGVSFVAVSVDISVALNQWHKVSSSRRLLPCLLAVRTEAFSLMLICHTHREVCSMEHLRLHNCAFQSVPRHNALSIFMVKTSQFRSCLFGICDHFSRLLLKFTLNM